MKNKLNKTSLELDTLSEACALGKQLGMTTLEELYNFLKENNDAKSKSIILVLQEQLDKKFLSEEAHNQYAIPEGDRVKAFNNALTYAKKDNLPYIYGYTNHNGKFFALNQPIKCTGDIQEAEKKFKATYKNCVTMSVAYPDKEFID